MFTISLPVGISPKRFTDLSQVVRREVGVTVCHLRIRMAQEPLHRLEVGALHHQVRSKSVSEVMEVKIFNPRPPTGTSKPFFNVQ